MPPSDPEDPLAALDRMLGPTEGTPGATPASSTPPSPPAVPTPVPEGLGEAEKPEAPATADEVPPTTQAAPVPVGGNGTRRSPKPRPPTPPRAVPVSEEGIDRSPPHDTEAEHDFLGQLLHADGAGRREEVHRALTLVAPQDLYWQNLGTAYRVMARTIEDGRELTPAGMRLAIEAAGIPASVTSDLLLSIVERAYTSGSLVSLALRLRELSRRRRILDLVGRASSALAEGADPAVAHLREGLDALDSDATTEPTADVLSLGDLQGLDDDDGPQPLIGAHVLDEGGLGVFASTWGVGKSNLALDLGISMARGRETFLGLSLPEVPRGVLYWWLESNRFRVKKRLAALTEEGEALPGFHLFAPSGIGPDIMSPTGRSLAEGQLRHFRPAIWIIDTLSAAAPGLDENDNVEVKLLLHWLAGIRKRYGVAIVLLHHTKKPQGGKKQEKGDASDVRGVSALLGEADSILRLDKDREGIVAHWGKLRDCPSLPTLVLRMQDGRFHIEGERAVGRPGKGREKVLEALEAAAGSPRSYEALVAATGCGRRTVERTLSEDLIPSGLAERVADAGQGAFFRLKPKASA